MLPAPAGTARPKTRDCQMFTHRLEKSAAARSAVMIVSLVAGMLLGPVEASAANMGACHFGKARHLRHRRKQIFVQADGFRPPMAIALTFSIINVPHGRPSALRPADCTERRSESVARVYSDIRIPRARRPLEGRAARIQHRSPPGDHTAALRQYARKAPELCRDWESQPGLSAATPWIRDSRGLWPWDYNNTSMSPGCSIA
jgi:hypothetical protein